MTIDEWTPRRINRTLNLLVGDGLTFAQIGEQLGISHARRARPGQPAESSGAGEGAASDAGLSRSARPAAGSTLGAGRGDTQPAGDFGGNTAAM